jgi:hypothetical protein
MDVIGVVFVLVHTLMIDSSGIEEQEKVHQALWSCRCRI